MMVRLLFVVFLFGVGVFGQGGDVEDACSPLADGTPDSLSGWIDVMVNGNANTGVSEVREGNNISVRVTIPLGYSATSVDCLLGLGLARNWRRMMVSSCTRADVTSGSATCVFTVTNVHTSRDRTTERVDIRVGIEHTEGYLRAHYEDHPISYIPEQRDRRLVVPEPTSTPAPVVVAEQVKAEDPHDSKMEAYLAAKWAEQQQQMAEDEDKNSEGDWQKLEQDEKRQHEAEVQKELEEYEARTAEEQHRREEMIRREMMDKEENERLENEFHRKSSSTTHRTPTADPRRDGILKDENEVQLDNDIIVLDSGATHSESLIPALVLFMSTILAAILL